MLAQIIDPIVVRIITALPWGWWELHSPLPFTQAVISDVLPPSLPLSPSSATEVARP